MAGEARFDPDLLDEEDPFEIDSQVAHLFKHPHLGIEDIDDVWASDPLFYPAKPPGGFWWCHSLQLGTAMCVVAGRLAAMRLLRASPPSTGGTDEHEDDARRGV